MKDYKYLFEKSPIIPVIAQDISTMRVLMLAYMNEESLRLTLATGYAHYYSRSRNALWKKGETSGHFQQVAKVFSDCDNDTLLLLVKQTGVACHTGSYTCFFNEIEYKEGNR